MIRDSAYNLLPTGPTKALPPSPINNYNGEKVSFHMVNLFGRDEDREAGRRIGYPIHAHCWLIVGRFFGFELIQQNLRAFVNAVAEYWKHNKRAWSAGEEFPSAEERDCFDQGPIWGNRLAGLLQYYHSSKREVGRSTLVVESCRYGHQPRNPFRVSAIMDLIERVTKSCGTQRMDSNNKVSRSKESVQLPAMIDVPVEIGVLIVDEIWKSRPLCQGRIEDTRNLLEAFQWTLPSTYWIARCDPQVFYEVEDLIASRKEVDWVGLCLGLEKLMLDPRWFYQNGLHHRRKILENLGVIQKYFTRSLSHCQNGH